MGNIHGATFLEGEGVPFVGHRIVDQGLDWSSLLWCADVQDWRWSSRGVRDRALRLAHLFDLTPAFVVTDSATGYGCVVMEVGERRHSQVETPDGNHKAASRGNPAIP